MISIILGIVILIISSNLMIKNTIVLSKKLNISLITLSILINGILTSFPELLISLKAANINHTELIIGNIIGSNIANFTMILGIAAIVYPINFNVQFSHILAGIFIIIATFLLNLAIFTTGFINYIFGIIFLIMFIAYIYLTIFHYFDDNKFTEDKDKTIDSIWSLIFLIITSLIGLYIGPNMVINSSIEISQSMNISNEFIGATVIAIGTSLPELATCIQAQKYRKSEIVIGNIVGSNIFNTLFILGITSLVNPIFMPSKMKFDLIFMNLVTCLVLMFGYLGKINQKTGIMLLALEIIYIIYTILFII